MMVERDIARKDVEPRMRGVFTASGFEAELLPQHKKIIRRIVNEIINLAIAEVDVEGKVRSAASGMDPSRAYHLSIVGRQPHQSFLIDGPKGAGKTTLLLNLRCALEQIGPRGEERRAPNAFKVSELEPKDPATHEGNEAQNKETLASFSRLRVGTTTRFLVHALPLIRPDSLEMNESIIECVFAEMTHQLDLEIGADPKEACVPRPMPTWEAEKRRKRATELKQELHREVAKGWYFARRLGLEALLNDSMNYDEYIERRSEEAVVSHRRIGRWMRFVNDYLDHFESQTLAIFIDDTDISAELAADILHAIRMFFCHSRVVVLMAGNLHTMRQRLLTRAMTQQAEAHKSLRAPDSFTAKFWRDFERDNLEEYLSKVLPRPYRHFISPSSADAEQLLLRMSFVSFCGSQMQARLPEFLKERKTTRRRDKADSKVRWSRYEALLDLAQQQNRYHIEAENHTALWLLRNHYVAHLGPQTARHINQFRAMIEHRSPSQTAAAQVGLATAASSPSSRRVVVALFTHPGNHSVIQRQSDFDGDAAAWINRQNMGSSWRGARWLKLNELRLPHGTPSYELLLFRLDLILARPAAAWLTPGFATSLLPEPSGRKLWAPEIWQEAERGKPSEYIGYDNKFGTKAGWQIVDLPNHRLRLRQEMLGLARAFSSPIVPANCLYFKDLRSLPDIAWTWEESETSDYRRFFDQFPVRNVDNLFRLDRYDSRNDYFRDVVLVFASYPLVQPIPSEEFITGSTALHTLELTDLAAIWGPPEKTVETSLEFRRIRDVSRGLADLYRKALSGADKPVKQATLEMTRAVAPARFARHLAQKGIVGFGFKETAGRKRPRISRESLDIAQSLVSLVMPRYHRILNDVRRSYHAMRILESDILSYAFIAQIGPKEDSGAKKGAGIRDTVAWPPPFEHNRNDNYSVIGVDKFRALLGLPEIRRASREYPASDVDVPPKYVPPEIESKTADTRYWIPISRKVMRKGNEIIGVGAAGLLQPFSSVVLEHLTNTVHGRPDADYAAIGIGWFGRNLRQRMQASSGLDKLEKLLKVDPANELLYRLSFVRTAGDAPFGERKWKLYRYAEGASQELPPLQDARPSKEKRPADAESEKGILLRLLKHVCDQSGYSVRPDEYDEATRPRIPLLFDTRNADHAQESRMYRSILLMLWGLSPCLSSLVHLEVMGRYYWWLDQDQHICLSDIADNLDDWEVSIVYALACVIALGLTLEVNLDADFRDASNKRWTPQFCAIPDISIAPLGLRLYVGDDPVRPDDTYTGVAPEEFANRQFGGIIGDLLMRLQLTLYYIEVLRGEFGKIWKTLKFDTPSGNSGSSTIGE